MIVAIEIKSTEECPIRRFPEMDYCNILLKRCIGLESLDCPMRAIRCETCGVATYELPDKPQYCKDCEHTKRDERFKDKPWILRFSCVHLEWLKKSGFYMDEFDNDISEYVIDKLQPPPNCHCFTKRQPKESK